MKSFVFTALSILLLTACNKNEIPSGIASCVKNEILANKDNPDWYIGTLEEYTFQNKTVYGFLPDGNIIADGSSTIKDENCNTLCNIGGLGGPAINQCNGENFYEKAVFVRTVWKKKNR